MPAQPSAHICFQTRAWALHRLPCDSCELGDRVPDRAASRSSPAARCCSASCSGVYPISIANSGACDEEGRAFLTDLQIVVYYTAMATTPLAPLTGKRILVTGVTGMVAGPMAAQLAAAGNTVYGAARFADPAQTRARTKPTASPRSASISSSAELDEIPDGLDYVLNFAVAKTNDFGRDLAANADGAAHLMEKVQGVDAFFHCSSGGVYQEHEHDHLKEDAAARRQPPRRRHGELLHLQDRRRDHGAVHRQAPRHPHRHRAAERAVRRHLRVAVLPRDDARARHGDPGAHRCAVAVQPAQPRRHRGVAPLHARVGVDAGERRQLGRRRDRERRGVVRRSSASSSTSR